MRAMLLHPWVVGCMASFLGSSACCTSEFPLPTLSTSQRWARSFASKHFSERCLRVATSEDASALMSFGPQA